MSVYGRPAGDTPGQRVRFYREARSLSQLEIGQALVPPRTHAAISDIERGKTRMTAELADALASVLRVTRWDLLGDTEIAPPPRDETIDALVAALVRAEREIDRLRALVGEVGGE